MHLCRNDETWQEDRVGLLDLLGTWHITDCVFLSMPSMCLFFELKFEQ